MHNESSTLDRNLHFVSSLLVFLFSATLLASGKSYSYIAFILAIFSFFILPITLKKKVPIKAYRLWFLMSGYFFITLTSLLWNGGDLSNLDAPSRSILLFPALIFLLSYPPKKEWVLKGILLGSFISGLIALYHTQILNIRAFSSFKYMVIQSGNIAASLGVLSFVIFFYFFKEKNKNLSILSLISSLLGIFASLLSGARGGWVLLPFVLIWLLIINRHLIPKKMITGMMIIGILSSLLGYHIAEKRIALVFDDITQLTEKNDPDSSSGSRILMWKAGVYAFKSAPIFGIGYDNRKDFLKELVNKNKVNALVLRHGRLHSNYIEELAMKGIIGFISLMTFFLAPIYFFLCKKNLRNNVFAQLGVTHIILVMGYCLTQNYINHQSGMIQYLMFVIIFYSIFFNETIKKKKEK